MKRAVRDERGASLILAIAFMVVIGMISAAILSSISSGLNTRTALDTARNREYAADGGIEAAIAQIRARPSSAGYRGPAFAPCGPFEPTPSYPVLNGVPIRVDCVGEPTFTLGSLFLQQNVLFNACVIQNPDVPCGQPTTPIIIRAQVNFQTVAAGSVLQVQRTWIQSWSVNG